MIADFIRTSPLRALLLAAGCTSAAMLCGAWVAQYGFGLHPCELCMAQRYPYMAILVIAAAACLIPSPRRQWHAALLCGALFLLDAGIAGYHTGVELGVFKGPSACSGAALSGQSLEEMRRIIMNAALMPCNQPAAYFLGLSMAAWNSMIATLLGVSTWTVLYRLRRHPGLKL